MAINLGLFAEDSTEGKQSGRNGRTALRRHAADMDGDHCDRMVNVETNVVAQIAKYGMTINFSET